MERLLIKHAHVVSPAEGINQKSDVCICDGKIEQIGENLSDGTARVLDAEGLYLSPGLIDMHVHFRDPGLTYKEDLYTGAKAAAHGGFTSVLCMPNTKPALDSVERIDYIVAKAQEAACRVYPIAAITKGQKGEELVDFSALKQAGAVAFSEDGRCVKNAAKMRDGMISAYKAGAICISHCEDEDLTQGGIMHKGRVSEELGVKGIDRLAEDVMTAREMTLSSDLDIPVHIAHVSTEGSFAIVRDAKRRGVKITCETCPHYFVFTHEELRKRDANYRMNPPLREEKDRQATLQAIQDGTVDAIITDHAPHSTEEKRDFETALNGIVGLETSFALSVTYLVKTGRISLERLLELMSVNPARIVGIPGGTLKVGAAADFFLYDLDKPYRIDKNTFFSKGQNTPFDGMEVYGKVHYTFVNGKETYREEENHVAG